jgi:chromosome segregation ATPase
VSRGRRVEELLGPRGRGPAEDAAAGEGAGAGAAAEAEAVARALDACARPADAAAAALAALGGALADAQATAEAREGAAAAAAAAAMRGEAVRAAAPLRGAAAELAELAAAVLEVGEALRGDAAREQRRSDADCESAMGALRRVEEEEARAARRLAALRAAHDHAMDAAHAAAAREREAMQERVGSLEAELQERAAEVAELEAALEELEDETLLETDRTRHAHPIEVEGGPRGRARPEACPCKVTENTARARRGSYLSVRRGWPAGRRRRRGR